MVRTVRRRLLLGMGANMFGNSATVFIQIVTVPLLMHYWGPALYGAWLVLSAIPGYLAFTDLGFANIAGNEMTVLVGRDDERGARAVFQSVWIFLTLISVSVMVIGSLAVWIFPLDKLFHLQALESRDVRIVAVVLLMYLCMVLQSGLVTAAFRSTGDYAIGAVYYSLARILEACAVIAAAMRGGTLLAAALALLLTRLLILLITAQRLFRFRPWLWFGWRDAKKAVVLELAPSALAFVALPLASAMNLQGMILTIGLVLGPIAVVTFSTLRTLSRIPLSLMGIVNNAVWPEITSAFAQGNIGLMRILHRASSQTVLWAMLPILAALGLTGRRLLRAWTHGEVHFDGPVFYTLLAVIAVNTFWYTSSVILLGATAHRQLSARVLMGSGVSVGLSWLLLPTFGLVGAAAALLVVDLMLTPYAVKQSLRLTGDNLKAFGESLRRPPRLRILFRQPEPETQHGAG